jgi:hypothetical protein
MVPPKTDVGIRQACRTGKIRLRELAASRLNSKEAMTSGVPHVLKSQKFSMLVSLADVFISIENIHIFQSVEAFSAFELIDTVVEINVELIAAQNRNDRGFFEGENEIIVNRNPVSVECDRNLIP